MFKCYFIECIIEKACDINVLEILGILYIVQLYEFDFRTDDIQLSNAKQYKLNLLRCLNEPQ